MRKKKEINVLNRLDELGIEYSKKYDIHQIENMSRDYFTKKLRYKPRLKKSSIFGKNVETVIFQERTSHILDKAIMKYYHHKCMALFEHLKNKPNDTSGTIEKYIQSINNMLRIFHANPFIRRNTMRLWRWKPVLAPMLPDGSILEIPLFNKDESIDKHLIG